MQCSAARQLDQPCTAQSANFGKFWLNSLNLAPFLFLNPVRQALEKGNFQNLSIQSPILDGVPEKLTISTRRGSCVYYAQNHAYTCVEWSRVGLTVGRFPAAAAAALYLRIQQLRLGRRPNGFLGLFLNDGTILFLVFSYWIRQSQSDKTVFALRHSPPTYMLARARRR